MTKHDSGGILSSFYSIISGGNEGSGKLSESENAAKLSRECVAELQPELIVTESKFLRLDSLHELVKEQFYKARDIIKAGCVSRWSSSIYYPMRNSGQIPSGRCTSI